MRRDDVRRGKLFSLSLPARPVRSGMRNLSTKDNNKNAEDDSPTKLSISDVAKPFLYSHRTYVLCCRLKEEKCFYLSCDLRKIRFGRFDRD